MAEKRWMIVLSGLVLMVILGLVACGPAPTATPAPVDTPTPVGSGSEEHPASNVQTAPLIHQAIEDLSRRLDLDPQQIRLQAVEDVQWRDSSLGCPEPGQNYLMVITPGYRIYLEAEGQVYEYHADEKHVVHCDNPQPPLETGNGSD